MLWLALAGAWFGTVAMAQPRPVQDPPIRYKQFHVEHEIRPDLSAVQTRSWSVSVHHAQAVEWAKKADVTYSTSIEKVQVLHAYTLKADGRRLDAPKENFQAQVNQGRNGAAPLFSDQSTLSVVFPDVAVGDTVAMSVRIEQAEPTFPGHVDIGYTFMRETPYDDVRVSVRHPATLKLRHAARQMKEETETLPDGTRRLSFSWSNPTAQRDPRRDYSVWVPDEQVGVSLSTYESHRAIAEAYGRRALPKAVPDERVRKLAAEIVGSQTEPRAKARALFDWVSTQITYGGNCVGVGTVVPRDLGQVLDNRMGDCKDHATLLQALLAAQGIESDQVLINSGREVQLPALPLVSSVNHVMNYLPAWGLYVDATAKGVPFGVVPIGSRGKPVLHVGQWREGARTPVPVPAREQRTASQWKLHPDGSLSGTVTVVYQGDAAIDMRAWVRNQPAESRPDMVREMLRSMGLTGRGRVDFEDATALATSYRMTLHLERVERFFRWPGQGTLNLFPFVGGTTVGQFAQQDDGEPVRYATACTSGVAEETYTVALPKGMKITSMPPAAQVRNSVQRFESRHQLKGGVLTVRRRVEDMTPGAVCPPAIGDEYRVFGGQVLENLKLPVMYR